jgi:hypothetical protein
MEYGNVNVKSFNVYQFISLGCSYIFLSIGTHLCYRRIIYPQPHTTQNFINESENWHVTQKVQTSSLRIADSCRNMQEQQSEIIN